MKKNIHVVVVLKFNLLGHTHPNMSNNFHCRSQGMGWGLKRTWKLQFFDYFIYKLCLSHPKGPMNWKKKRVIRLHFVTSIYNISKMSYGFQRRHIRFLKFMHSSTQAFLFMSQTHTLLILWFATISWWHKLLLFFNWKYETNIFYGLLNPLKSYHITL